MLEQGLHSFQSKICITTFFAIKGITAFCLGVKENSQEISVVEKLQGVILNEKNQFFRAAIDAILRTFLRLETTNLELVVE